MGKKQLNKEQLLYLAMMREKKRKEAELAPFTIQGILGNYSLWKCEGYGQKKLLLFNQYMKEQLVTITEEELEEKRLRLADLSDELTITVVPRVIGKKSTNDIVYNIAMDIQRSENQSDYSFYKYNILFFSYLYNQGYREKRLLRIKQYLVDLINRAAKCDLTEQLHKELTDEAGICISYMGQGVPEQFAERQQYSI